MAKKLTVQAVFSDRDKVYLRCLQASPRKSALVLLSSSDGLNFKTEPVKRRGTFNGKRTVVPSYRYKNRYVSYSGGNILQITYSGDLKKWEKVPKPILKLEDGLTLQIGGLFLTAAGIILVYLLKGSLNGEVYFSLRTLLLDRRNPQRILWPKSKVLWDAPQDWQREGARFLGVAEVSGRIISYWEKNEEILALIHLPTKALESKVQTVNLRRVGGQPLLRPHSEHSWESKAVFNPAAIYEGKKVHLIYRAIGDRDVSVLGYASSSDGTQIDERLSEPIYVPTQPFECGTLAASFYTSGYLSGGGGYGGCEDPRIVRIEDKLYMTYVAFDGCNPPRVALTSIKVEDFLARRFRWSTPVLISPPGVVDKNACLLPEKVGGKYVIFHRVYPDILIDFVDDLDFDGKTKWLKGEFKISPRPSFWDSRKIGVGAPPIKTDDGWLLIYQAVGNQDPGRYKMGAMILALTDPTQVLYRSERPILSPDENYENEGYKSGVVYPCGAVTIKDELFVYYGGADTVVCGAKAKLAEFISQLKSDEVPQFQPVHIQPVYH